MESMVQTPGVNRAKEYTEAAERSVRNYCRWHIAPVIEATLTLDGTGTNTLFIPSLRIESITAVSVDGVDLDPATLEWSQDGYARLPQGFIWGDRLRGVRIQLRHGFESAPDVVEIIRAMAVRAVNGPVLKEGVAGGPYQEFSMVAPGVAGGVVLMEHEREQLQPYRLGLVG